MNKKNNKNHFIDVKLLAELLYHNDKYVKEFAGATVKSFSEFRENYAKYLLDRDEVNFRKAGHKIKPVAQMLKLDEVIDEYEHGKTLLWDEKDREALKNSAEKVDRLCDIIIEELKSIEE